MPKIERTPIKQRATAWLLAGGGLKGALQLGYRRAADARGWTNLRWVRGVSTGALQAVCWGMGYKDGVRLSETMWRGLTKREDLFEVPSVWPRVGSVLWNLVTLRPKNAISGALGKELLSNAPLRRLLREKIDVQKIRESGIETKVGVVDLVTGNYYEVGPENRPDQEFIDFTGDSTAIPGSFQASQRQSVINHPPRGWYVDGGVTSMIPSIDDLISAGAERIIVALCNPINLPPEDEDYSGAWDSINRALGVTLHDNWTGDLLRIQRRIEQINEEIREGVAKPGKRIIDFIVLAPQSIPPIGTLEVVQSKITKTSALGEIIAGNTFDSYYLTERD